jgi:hypothetical protein
MSAPQKHEISTESLQRGHEQSDLSTKTLFWGLVVLLVFTSVAAFAMVLMWDVLDARVAGMQPAPSPLVETDIEPPEPRLETTPSEVRTRIDALRALQSSTYTWIDRDGGVARIPVDRAMAIVVERGLPYRGAEAAPEVQE